MLPETVVLLLTVRVALTAPPTVRDLQVAVDEMVGWLTPVKLASPIMASTVGVGTPAVQLAAVDQFVLVVPFQLVCADAATPEMMSNVLKKNWYRFFIKVY